MKKNMLKWGILALGAGLLLAGCPTDPDDDDTSGKKLKITGITLTGEVSAGLLVDDPDDPDAMVVVAGGSATVSGGNVTIPLKIVIDNDDGPTNNGWTDSGAHLISVWKGDYFIEGRDEYLLDEVDFEEETTTVAWSDFVLDD